MSIAQAQPRELLTPQQAAQRLNVSVRTIRRYIASGDLTGYRLGPRMYRVDVAELDAVLRPIPVAGGDHG